MQLDVTVNGETRRLQPGLTVSELRELSGAARDQGIAVAINGEVVPRAEWQQREVRNGDAIEIVQAVQGG